MKTISEIIPQLQELYKLPPPLLYGVVERCQKDLLTLPPTSLLDAILGDQTHRPRNSVRSLFVKHLRQAQTEYLQTWVEPLKHKLAYIEVVGIGQRFVTGEFVQDPSLLPQALLPVNWQSPTENYRPGDKLAVYVQQINRVQGWPGAEILVSRNCHSLVHCLFEEIVPGFKEKYQVVWIERRAGEYSKVQLRHTNSGSLVSSLNGSGSFKVGSGRKVKSGRNSPPQEEIDPEFLSEIAKILWDERLELIYL